MRFEVQTVLPVKVTVISYVTVGSLTASYQYLKNTGNYWQHCMVSHKTAVFTVVNAWVFTKCKESIDQTGRLTP